MECQSCREALTALLDEELGSDLQSEIRSHLSKCSACKAEYDSLLFSFDLTERVDSIQLNPKIWTRIQREVAASLNTPTKKDLRPFFRSLFIPRWRPAAAAIGLVVIAAILFFSSPGSGTDPALEKEFTIFILQREEISRQNRRILFELRQTADDRASNPFVVPISQEQRNPFRE